MILKNLDKNWIRTPEESKSTKRTSWIEPNVDSNCGYIENNSKSNSRKRIHIEHLPNLHL